MPTVQEEQDLCCHGISRREALRWSGMGTLSVWGGLQPGPAVASSPAAGRSFGRARSVIVFSLWGGPAHQDTFDLKPDAPAEFRGEFQPIETNVSGIRICEYLPRLARLAHHYALVRSVTHEDTSHESALYTELTGWPHPQPNTNPGPTPFDYPPYGTVMGVLRPPQAAVPSYVIVGNVQATGVGQTGGFLGQGRAPFVIEKSANERDFRVRDLSPSREVTDRRIRRRRRLLDQLDGRIVGTELPETAQGMEAMQRQAFELLAHSHLGSAFSLESETRSTRDRYGRHDVGQNLLLARRLVEAGVPAIQVSWNHRGPWDTHGDNFNSLKGSLLPRLDQGLSALLDDLHRRGLLEQTLVLVCGEFGRTPRINELAGRDHWPNCYSVLLAGGGIRGGQVYGASDAVAAYPSADPVGPWDLGATVLHCAGIGPASEIRDPQNRPLRICRGNVIDGLL
jgi:hypothetical protein